MIVYAKDYQSVVSSEWAHTSLIAGVACPVLFPSGELLISCAGSYFFVKSRRNRFNVCLIPISHSGVSKLDHKDEKPN